MYFNGWEVGSGVFFVTTDVVVVFVLVENGECGVFAVEVLFALSAWGFVLVGVFTFEEKVAKAPDPRPNAEEAEAEGEGREVRGLTLKGLKCRP